MKQEDIIEGMGGPSINLFAKKGVLVVLCKIGWTYRKAISSSMKEIQKSTIAKA
jgi:hypothetical protein